MKRLEALRFVYVMDDDDATWFIGDKRFPLYELRTVEFDPVDLDTVHGILKEACREAREEQMARKAVENKDARCATCRGLEADHDGALHAFTPEEINQ